MKKFLIFCIFTVGVFVSFFIFPEGAIATLFSTAVCIFSFVIIDRIFESESAEFLKKAFLIALVARIFLAVAIYTMEWENTFGPDSETFDYIGRVLSDYWRGTLPGTSYSVRKYANFTYPGWGMHHLVGIIYFMSGRNPIAVQFLSCTLGAATVPTVYYCALKIFRNIRVAKYSAILVAFYPAMIIWSSQMLKDGIIVFLLAICMACVITLHEKINYGVIFLMLLSLVGLLSMRSYIFYMAGTAIIGSFIIGAGKTAQSVGKRLIVLLLFGVALGYIGFGSASSSGAVDTYTDIERLQVYRKYQAEGQGSSFGEEFDVSTIEGTATFLPLGIAVILFAPFPWQMTNFRQLIILPEMLFWWACIPFLIKGLVYTIKNRLKPSISILTFSLMLTVAYAIFQSNIGAAYRQRTQIQLFLFIFIAVGLAIYKEKSENKDFTFKPKVKKA